MAELIFLTSVGLIVYVYLGYPALVFLLSRIFPRPFRSDESTPRVSLVITAHNEERHLAAKLLNSLSLDYPREQLEIIVASDHSTDRTDEIARQFEDRGIRLYRHPSREGKTIAQAGAVRSSASEIVVFSDATTMYQPDALRQIVRAFADPAVGCVSGQLIYLDESESATGQGCRSYWSYEKFLRQRESCLGSLIGVSGCLHAVRRACFIEIADRLIEDFVIAIEMQLQGRRTVYSPQAIAIEETCRHSRDEFRMRVRIVVQTLTALFRYRRILNPFRHGVFAWQMLSHKVLRYAIPFLLVGVFASSLRLREQSFFFQSVVYGQVAFYLAALAALVIERMGFRPALLSIPLFFTLVNFASVVGLFRLITARHSTTWQPIRYSSQPAEPSLSGKSWRLIAADNAVESEAEK